MQVRLIRDSAVRDCLAVELPTLLTVDDALVWVDIYPDHVFVVLHAPELGERATSTTSSWTSSCPLGTW